MNGTPTEPTKPGIATSEFWTLIIHYLITIWVNVMVFLHPGYHLSAGAQGLVDAIVPAASMLAAAIATAIYARSRSQVKQAVAFARSNADFSELMVKTSVLRHQLDEMQSMHHAPAHG